MALGNFGGVVVAGKQRVLGWVDMYELANEKLAIQK